MTSYCLTMIIVEPTVIVEHQYKTAYVHFHLLTKADGGGSSVERSLVIERLLVCQTANA